MGMVADGKRKGGEAAMYVGSRPQKWSRLLIKGLRPLEREQPFLCSEGWA